MSITLSFVKDGLTKEFICNDIDEDGDYIVTKIIKDESVDGMTLNMTGNCILMNKGEEIVIRKTGSVGVQYRFVAND